jgi:DNA invertase Pin-like site-specific DNA recombinase
MTAPAAEKRLRVLEFERVSTDKQELKRQAADLKRNRAQHSLEALRTFSVKVSGTKVMSNSDVRRMYAEMSDPNIDGISVSAIDRIFRPKDFAQISEVLQFFHTHKKVIVSTVEGVVEPWTPNGWMTCMQAAMKAGAEWHELKRRTAGGRETTRADKKSCAPCPTYGLRYVSKYQADADGNAQYYVEDTTPTNVEGITRRQIVEKIFMLRYRHRLTPAAIARRITATGVLSGGKQNKDGSYRWKPGTWTAATVRQMLQNRHYIGEHWERETLVECACPAFIDRAVFDGVQKLWTADLGNGRPSVKHLLSRFLICKHCGHRLRITGGKYKSYRCGSSTDVGRRHCPRLNNYISCGKIEAVVWRTVWSALTKPDLLLRSAQSYYENLPKVEGLAALQHKAKTIKQRIDDTKYMVRARVMDRDEAVALLQEDQRQLAEVEADIRAMGSVVALPTALQAAAGCRLIADPKAEPETFSQRRPILERLVDLECKFDGEFVEIEGKIPVPAIVQNSPYGMECTDSSVLHIPFILKERVA